MNFVFGAGDGDPEHSIKAAILKLSRLGCPFVRDFFRISKRSLDRQRMGV